MEPGQVAVAFEQVLTGLPNGVLVVDRGLRVAYVNPAAQRLLPTEAPMRRGDPLPDPWPELSLRSLAGSLFDPGCETERHLVETDDRVVCVEGLPTADAATATLLLDDVTERERTRQSERQFVDNAAHELRTPLAAIVSVVDVLDAGAKDDPATRDRFLAHIRAHSERLVRLATSLLVLARIQAGRAQPRLDLVPVRPLLEEVAAELVPAAEVRVEVRAAPELGVLGDRDLLFQALENVAANSVRHTRKGAIVLEARDLGPAVEIELSDTGSGMEPTDAANAFDRFYRSRERDREGFGLGLAIAKEAIDALGGTIKLESTQGAGTRVRIGLPRARIVG